MGRWLVNDGPDKGRLSPQTRHQSKAKEATLEIAAQNTTLWPRQGASKDKKINGIWESVVEKLVVTELEYSICGQANEGSIAGSRQIEYYNNGIGKAKVQT